jgi:hypothetical protein
MAIAHTDELKIRPCDLDLCRFQTLLWTKYVCTKFGQNPLKDVDSRVFTRMLRGSFLTYITGFFMNFELFTILTDYAN